MAARKAPKGPKMGTDGKLIIRRDQEENFRPAMVNALARLSDKEEQNFKWKERIKPSGIDFDMCIEDYQATVRNYRRWDITQRMGFELGNAFHSFIGRFYYKNYPEIYYGDIAIPEHVHNWHEKIKPEVPLDSSEWMVRCMLDFPAKIKGKLRIVDWKTTRMEPAAWDTFREKPFVSSSYLAQGASYCFLYDYHKYFAEFPETFSFVYINLKMDIAEPDAWKEVVFESRPYVDQVKVLWEILREATIAMIKGETVHCKNPLCKLHGKGKLIRAAHAFDPWSPIAPPSFEETGYEFIRANKFVDKARNSSEEIRGAQSIRSYTRQESFR